MTTITLEIYLLNTEITVEIDKDDHQCWKLDGDYKLSSVREFDKLLRINFEQEIIKAIEESSKAEIEYLQKVGLPYSHLLNE